MLTGEIKLVGFYQRVFPFVLSTLNNEKDKEKIKKQEQDMWVYAAYQQMAYAKSLSKKKSNLTKEKYKEFKELAKSIDRQHGYGQFKSVEKLYNQIVAMDNIPCAYADRICNVAVQNNSEDFIIEDIKQLDYLLSHIAKNMNLFAETARCIQKIEGKEVHDPVPAKIIASLAVFTSHIGRAVCLHYSGETQKKSKEIDKSIDHLRRCAMDTCKLTIDYL